MLVSIDCETSFEAPVNSNLEIGAVKIQIDDNIILSTSIITGNTINKKSAFSYYKYFLKDFPYILQNSLSFWTIKFQFVTNWNFNFTLKLQ